MKLLRPAAAVITTAAADATATLVAGYLPRRAVLPRSAQNDVVGDSGTSMPEVMQTVSWRIDQRRARSKQPMTQ